MTDILQIHKPTFFYTKTHLYLIVGTRNGSNSLTFSGSIGTHIRPAKHVINGINGIPFVLLKPCRAHKLSIPSYT